MLLDNYYHFVRPKASSLVVCKCQATLFKENVIPFSNSTSNFYRVDQQSFAIKSIQDHLLLIPVDVAASLSLQVVPMTINESKTNMLHAFCLSPLSKTFWKNASSLSCSQFIFWFFGNLSTTIKADHDLLRILLKTDVMLLNVVIVLNVGIWKFPRTRIFKKPAMFIPFLLSTKTDSVNQLGETTSPLNGDNETRFDVSHSKVFCSKYQTLVSFPGLAQAFSVVTPNRAETLLNHRICTLSKHTPNIVIPVSYTPEFRLHLNSQTFCQNPEIWFTNY